MIKLTIFLQVDQATPSESWYFSQFDSIQDTAALAAMVNVVAARANLVCRPAAIIGARMVSSQNPRYAQYLKPGTFQVNNSFPGDTPDRDYSSVVWVADLAGGRIARRYLAGCPDNVIGNQVGNQRGFNDVGGFGAQFTNWVQVLIDRAAQVRVLIGAFQQVDSLPTAAQFPGLIGVQVANQIVFQLPFFGPGTLPPVQAIRLRGFRSFNPRAAGLHGVYKVAGVVPPTTPATSPWTYYLYGTSNVNPANIEVRGQACALQYTAATVTTGGIHSVTHHKRGGRVFVPVGRSRTRV